MISSVGSLRPALFICRSGSPLPLPHLVSTQPPRLNRMPLVRSVLEANAGRFCSALRQSCSLLWHFNSAPPSRGCWLPSSRRCASSMSSNRALVKGVLAAKSIPPLMRLAPAPGPIQSSFVRRKSLPAAASSAAMMDMVSCAWCTRAASASSTMTCEKFSGLPRYSSIIRCFSQLKVSCAALRRHLASSLFFAHFACSRWGISSVSRVRRMWACPWVAVWTLFDAKHARSHRGRVTLSPAEASPQTLFLFISTVWARSIFLPPVVLFGRSTTRSSAFVSQEGAGSGEMGSPWLFATAAGTLGGGGSASGSSRAAPPAESLSGTGSHRGSGASPCSPGSAPARTAPAPKHTSSGEGPSGCIWPCLKSFRKKTCSSGIAGGLEGIGNLLPGTEPSYHTHPVQVVGSHIALWFTFPKSAFSSSGTLSLYDSLWLCSNAATVLKDGYSSPKVASSTSLTLSRIPLANFCDTSLQGKTM
mmetsp:Transcript_107065/g.290130  ORF Transcript_107065/g.290130 Transcript_107065/m.290130 type:complete len:474 (+) Transcript_107065:223-1644(+)